MMLIRRIAGGSPLHGLQCEMDRMFRGLLTEDCGRSDTSESHPALDVWEDDKNVFIETELPGLAIDDVDVSLVDDELTIKAEHTIEEVEGVRFHRRERYRGSLCRTLHIPMEIDSDRVAATLDKGVLRVTLPKAEKILPRKIVVKAE